MKKRHYRIRTNKSCYYRAQVWLGWLMGWRDLYIFLPEYVSWQYGPHPVKSLQEAEDLIEAKERQEVKLDIERAETARLKKKMGSGWVTFKKI